MNEQAAINLLAIRTGATMCPTCGGAPNAANFGGMCTPCNERKARRLATTARVLRDTGNTHSQEYRALVALGYAPK